MPFSRGSSQLRDWTKSLTSPALAGGFFTSSTTWEAPIIWHLKQIGKVKKLNKWVLHELSRNLKYHQFWSVSFSYFTQQWTTSLSDYDCATKSGFYTTNSNDQLSHWTRKKLQSTSQRQTCTTKRWWSLFGALLLVWSTTAFWILGKPLHLRSMLSKLMRCTENCNACSRHWPIEWAQFSTQHLTTCHATSALKVEQIRLWNFVPSAIFTWPLTNWLPLF